jgi:NTE family protein
MKGDLETEDLRKSLPGLFGDLDEATFEAFRPHLVWTWVELSGGAVLFNEGDPSDSLYMVTSGRLQASVMGPDGEAQIVGEIGRGESVGEMGVFTGKPRRATITALRDSVLARIELAVFHEMLKASPTLMLNLNRVIIERLERRNISQKTVHNITNLAVLSVSEGLAAFPVLEQLVAALQRLGQKVLLLTSAAIDAAAGRPGAAQAGEDDLPGRRWLVKHLDELEGSYDLVFYETDSAPTAWTHRCLRQADEVLLLADGAASSELSSLEQACLSGSQSVGRARQTLVLLHPAGSEVAKGTRRFLAARPRVYRHFHVRAGAEKDLDRVARFLSNQAVGLVLAGGGARGLAHIGVFRALLEAGVPIDAVGGTSIGSVLGACLAVGWDWEKIYRENKREFLSNPTSDFNLVPLVSLLAGRKLERILETFLGGIDIEDLAVPFFCVSSNYTQACEHVHARGNLKWALLASMAIPGVFPPIVHENNLLVDGGVFNNMPVDVMARTGVRTILAVDLRPQDKKRGPLNFEQVPRNRVLLMDRLRHKANRRYPLPTMLTTLMAANTLNSDQKMSAVAHDVDLLFHPEVSHFGLLEWKSFDLLVDQGYRHAREVLAKYWPLPPGPPAGGGLPAPANLPAAQKPLQSPPAL